MYLLVGELTLWSRSCCCFHYAYPIWELGCIFCKDVLNGSAKLPPVEVCRGIWQHVLGCLFVLHSSQMAFELEETTCGLSGIQVFAKRFSKSPL